MSIDKAKDHIQKAIEELDEAVDAGEAIAEDLAEVKSYLRLAGELLS